LASLIAIILKFNNKHLIPAKDGQFTLAKGGQSHWLFQLIADQQKLIP